MEAPKHEKEVGNAKALSRSLQKFVHSIFFLLLQSSESSFVKPSQNWVSLKAQQCQIKDKGKLFLFFKK
jgi:hypothetical protein